MDHVARRAVWAVWRSITSPAPWRWRATSSAITPRRSAGCVFVVCYVCGALEVDLRTCLLGVAIGEDAICAVYVFAGQGVLRWVIH